MCSLAWSMDILSTASTSCCRGPGKKRILSRDEVWCKLRTLTSVVLCASSHPFWLPLFAVTRSLHRRHEALATRESRCAVHSCALVDGPKSLLRGSWQPSRRIFPSVGRSHITGTIAWSRRPFWGVATGKITCVPSSWICTRSHPLVAELRVQNVALISSIDLPNLALRPHARGASSLRCLTAARALTSALAASRSPQ
ncbi:hypothetical protein AB7M56_005775 [Bradyrhizobium elkanii]|nr:hypothetical protein [Bradyrhizobium elkanii]MCS4075501.1 hypothetical protein [Bradyrhizobium elkanii]MCS4082134.1 hypothetical protein [Bradyrhizobium elkanii]MDH6693722.1 hypothetical protein [Bradyrhizobium elkanii]